MTTTLNLRKLTREDREFLRFCATYLPYRPEPLNVSSEFKTIKQAAIFFEISTSSIHSFIRNGFIRKYKDGVGGWLVSLGEIHNLLVYISSRFNNA